MLLCFSSKFIIITLYGIFCFDQFPSFLYFTRFFIQRSFHLLDVLFMHHGGPNGRFALSSLFFSFYLLTIYSCSFYSPSASVLSVDLRWNQFSASPWASFRLALLCHILSQYYDPGSNSKAFQLNYVHCLKCGNKSRADLLVNEDLLNVANSKAKLTNAQMNEHNCIAAWIGLVGNHLKFLKCDEISPGSVNIPYLLLSSVFLRAYTCFVLVLVNYFTLISRLE